MAGPISFSRSLDVLKLRLGLLYGILVALLVIMGLWWVYYLTTENRAQTEAELQKLVNNRIHAAFLIKTDPQVRADPDRWLGESFPDLVFTRLSDGTVNVEINSEVKASILSKGAHTRRMFVSEGLFFLILLAAGSGILIHSWRSEIQFKQARELFLTSATHEFKTPLASLRLYTETLGREGLGEQDRQRIRTRMIEDVTRLEELVDDVLAASASDLFSSGPRSTLDLAAECKRVLDDLEGFAAKNKADFILVAEPGVMIHGHRVALSLALRNLLVNAVQHCPHPVRVVITVIPGATQHRITVQDDGPGIPRRLQEKVFECFFSSRQKGRTVGSGLGLYLVRHNLEILGGTVVLECEPEQGCTFTLALPAHGPATS